MHFIDRLLKKNYNFHIKIKFISIKQRSFSRLANYSNVIPLRNKLISKSNLNVIKFYFFTFSFRYQGANGGLYYFPLQRALKKNKVLFTILNLTLQRRKNKHCVDLN